MRVKYEERREYNASGGYQFTNESVELTAEIVRKNKPVKRIAGICSSGDLLLGVFAPNAEECVVAVDHALHSIKAALTKAVLVEHLTGMELKRLLDDAATHYNKMGSYGYASACKLQDAINEAIKELPREVAIQGTYYGDPLIVSGAKWGLTWKCVTAEDIDAARERLDNITVIHGDLRDLDGFPKFDLLYLSNAMEHTGFDGKGPDLNEIAEKFLTEDARALFTNGSPNASAKFSTNWVNKFEGKNEKVAFKHPEEMSSWHYNLLQRKLEAKTT